MTSVSGNPNDGDDGDDGDGVMGAAAGNRTDGECANHWQ
jgi:hypothetical protein